ncbi:SDR family NAD(P)-dependent oxidoreductase [Furfurilactobacillus entadae]|uniref:SDR family NAD(P)-dependent oxidoreductase n=1 Tax=Furfurilactobacillus entadae TaxID=2922307 RepID=UPI0035EB4023
MSLNNQPLTVLVTGGTSGVGRQTAKDLARRGVHVVLVSRDRQCGLKTAATFGHSNVEVLVADLTSQDSVNQLIETCHNHFDHLDGLVNAAGGVSPHLVKTADGLDQNLALNYTASYQLTTGLLDLLIAAPQGRVITVAALPAIIRLAPVMLPTLTPRTPYKASRVLSETLSARILATLWFADRFSHTNVTFNLFHPGSVPESHFGDTTSPVTRIMGRLLAKLSAKNTEIGARLMIAPQINRVSGVLFEEHMRQITLPKKYSASNVAKVMYITHQLLD